MGKLGKTGKQNMANPELCFYVKQEMGSNMGLAAAILTVCPMFFAVIYMMTDIFSFVGTAIFFASVFAQIEAWVTLGTARWGRGKISRGGIIVGKVSGIIRMVTDGILMVLLILMTGAYTIIARFDRGQYYELIEDILDIMIDSNIDLDGIAKMIVIRGTELIGFIFIMLFIPITVNIVMNAMINSFRDRLLKAIDGKPGVFRTTLPAAILIYISGIYYMVAAAIVILAAVKLEDFTLGFIVAAFSSLASLNFYCGTFLITFGKYKSNVNKKVSL